MRYRYIAFDLDGTLINSEDAILLSLRDALQQMTGKEYPLSELTFSLGIPGEDCLAQLGLPDPAGTLKLWETRIQDYQHLVHLFPGVPELLTSLAGHGAVLGAVTSKSRPEMEFDFIPLGLDKLLPLAVTASDTEEHKPHPAPLLKFMEWTGASPRETLYVGDSPYDRECAHRAGVDFALASWGCRGRELQAEHTPRSLPELLSIILGN